MKTTILPIFALMLGIATMISSSMAAGKPVKIYILAGQSNMVGAGRVGPATLMGTLEHLVANDPKGDYRFLVDGDGKWIVRDDVWIRDQKSRHGGLTAGYGSQAITLGPELGFGHRMGDLLDDQVLIVKAAWGGKNLAVDFRPPSSGGETGHYYNEVLRLLKEATTNLKTYFPDYNGQGYEIAGFAWHQGWNDRVNPAFTAEYATNMAHFIRDMRKAVGVPKLPFVIATTGMDGGKEYTKLELAQKSLADPGIYPEFVGNVAVIDTRMPYEGMTFWEQEEWSPKSQGFHWNQNARTYVNIGLAMADAMSTMTPGRSPFRLKATGGNSGVTLSWQNGTERPASVRVLRNGVEIAAGAPVDPATFADTKVPPGVYDYKLMFTMPGTPSELLATRFDGGITGLEWSAAPDGISLKWRNNMVYDGIRVMRNGKVVAAALSGITTTYRDASPPTKGLLTYTVAPARGSVDSATVRIDRDLIGELGILDLSANGGINPATRKPWKAGDQYRLAFVSSEKTPADSKDLGTYDAFLQGLAKSAKIGGIWKVIGSSATVDARDHTSTNPKKDGPGVAIYLLNGTSKVADSSIDLWNGDLDVAISRDERGNSGLTGIVHTGTELKGTKRHRPLGGSDEAAPKVTTGTKGERGRRWMASYNAAAKTPLSIYALSDPLTVKRTKE